MLVIVLNTGKGRKKKEKQRSTDRGGSTRFATLLAQRDKLACQACPGSGPLGVDRDLAASARPQQPTFHFPACWCRG